MKKILILIILSCTAALFSQNNEILILTYHTHAPFIIGNEEGLTYDLANYLSKKTEYNFTVKQMSRPKLDSLLSQNIVAIVPWVNPVWFNDIDEAKFFWTTSSIIDDSISYISNIDSPFHYNGVESLKNYIFGGLKGHIYKDLDKLVADKFITRLDSDNHIDNYRKLLEKRIDFTITSTSSAKYLISKYNMDKSLFISLATNSIYKRKAIISGKDNNLKKSVDEVIANMRDDENWNTILKKYR